MIMTMPRNDAKAVFKLKISGLALMVLYLGTICWSCFDGKDILECLDLKFSFALLMVFLRKVKKNAESARLTNVIGILKSNQSIMFDLK